MIKPIYYLMGVISSIVSAVCFTAHPKTNTSSAYKRHFLVLLNTIPPGFVCTFLITFCIHRYMSVDNASPCLSPTTVSKLGDTFPWIFVLLLVFQMSS